MKNIVIISDTHGRLPRNEEFWEALDNCDYIFHLGDGRGEIEKLLRIHPQKTYYVYGNCDFASDEWEKIVEVENMKFFLSHGHNYKVKSSDMLLQMRGAELGADCCLYGHTHRPAIDDYSNIKMINPGSLTFAKTYCFATVTHGKILARTVALRQS